MRTDKRSAIAAMAAQLLLFNIKIVHEVYEIDRDRNISHNIDKTEKKTEKPVETAQGTCTTLLCKSNFRCRVAMHLFNTVASLGEESGGPRVIPSNG